MLRLLDPLNPVDVDPAIGQRRLLADLCRFVGVQVGAVPLESLGFLTQSAPLPELLPETKLIPGPTPLPAIAAAEMLAVSTAASIPSTKKVGVARSTANGGESSTTKTTTASSVTANLLNSSAGPVPTSELSPRMKQTLRHLLDGDSEKQVARKLNISQHTVHSYVKALYRRFGVSSRAELLANHFKRHPEI